MSFAASLFVLSFTALFLGQPASAVQLVSQGRPSNNGIVTNSTVERGGTVDAVNTEKKTITVDGRIFAWGVAPVIFHVAPGKDAQGAASIPPGTKIRFNTSKNNYAGEEQIIEVWITEAAKQPRKK